jgi:hypothetical protein
MPDRRSLVGLIEILRRGPGQILLGMVAALDSSATLLVLKRFVY